MTVITTKPQKSNLLKLDVRAIRKMYQNGMSYREIARLFNKPPSTIYYYLKKQNTPMRKGKPFCL
ncbi:MAG: helix-turn-helix domain-containing protein, partial [Alphaproteobacteria bacterium]|nr:helix-turn-helix domain-containing protein [Alphaproteobacteria bacterium]